MIEQIAHPTSTTAPAGTTLALDVAYELNAPRPAALPIEVAAPQLMGLRLSAERSHLHKVPLRRLNAVHA
ncbi:hypothetical protein ABT124_15400 [Streptomyces sp. NPDC001982]|uniref:hypothetical protein n=1 Tax=unclassified Streptomyces TaxID=2593676 RepID=UPI003318ABBF